MAASASALGDLVDVAKALGLVTSAGDLNPGWFSDPGASVKQMLRAKPQRDALLRAIDSLLGDDASSFVDDGGRTWVPLVTEGGVALHLVVGAAGTDTIVALGADLRTAGPPSRTSVVVPLLRVTPTTVLPIPGKDLGRVQLRTEVELTGAPPAPGSASLGGIALDVGVDADGSDGRVTILLRGLQLPGQSAPHDLLLNPADPPAKLGDQALTMVLALVREAAPGAAGPLKTVLELLGLGGGAPPPGAAAGLAGASAIPELPVADILKRGVPAWRDWLGALLSSPAAIAAWLGRLAALAGPNAKVEPPDRVTWTVAHGIRLEARVRPGTTSAGAQQVEIGVGARADAAAGGLELDAVLARITLGTTPGLRAFPQFSLLGRLGADPPAGALLNTATTAPGTKPVIVVQALRAGLALDASRAPVFALAAHGVKIDAQEHPVLDLTNPHVLADAAVGQVLSAVLAKLGPAQAPVRVLAGLDAPPGATPWPPALTSPTDLLGDPIKAVAGYHARVLGQHRAGYPAVLAPLGTLLGTPPAGVAPAAGAALAVTGAGTEEAPWRVPLAEGVELVAWGAGELHLGLAIRRDVTNLGASCPTVALALSAELARVDLPARTAKVLGSASASLLFGARGAVPLRIGDGRVALSAQQMGVALSWGTGERLRARVVAPGLTSRVDGEVAPLALPELAADGTLAGDVPWRALELLAGHVLRRTGQPWADALAELAGWAPPAPGGPSRVTPLSLEALAGDPVRALGAWLRGQSPQRLAAFASLVLTGPAAAGLRAGGATGRGDAGDPLALPLVAGGAEAPRAALALVWQDTTGPRPASAYRPQRLLSRLAAGPGAAAPSAEELASALTTARSVSPTVADLLAGRLAVAAGFADLAARWLGSDGLVPAAAAVLPRAALHDLPGTGHLELPGSLDLAATLGVAPGPAVVFVTGPLGPDAWPGVVPGHTFDLTTPGAPPEAFDVSAARTQDGPWAVRLPRRPDAAAGALDGAAGQAARVARVVDAVVARRAGAGPVVIVAHGAAGHAAAVAAARPGVTHLVTLGTPHGGQPLDLAETGPAAGTLQLLAALLPPADPGRPEHPATARGRALLAPGRAAYDTPAVLSDLAPPAVAPAIPTTVAVHCVRGQADATTISLALSALVVRGLEEAAAADAAGGRGTRATRAGVGVRLTPPQTAGQVTVRATLAAILAGGSRGLRVAVDVERPGGWLAGGPGAARPDGGGSLRRATLELELPAGADGPVVGRIVLHEGHALGVRRTRWELGTGGEPLLPEARTLLARLGAALGPLPASGPVRNLVDVLAALGLTEPGTSATTGGPVSLALDGLQRLLVDPVGLVADASPAPLAAALARMLGAAAPAPATPARFGVDVDGLRATADLAARTLTLATITSGGLATAAGMRIVLGGTLQPGGGLTGTAGLTLGGGTRIDLQASPPSVTLVAAGAPDPVVLHPVPDGAGIARVLATAAPAHLLWAGVTTLRGLGAPAVPALVDPVLRALRLLRPDGRLVVPVGLLRDPASWLLAPLPIPPAPEPPPPTEPPGPMPPPEESFVGSSTTTPAPTAPDPIAALLDALGPLLGIPSGGPGIWRLPYGLLLGAAPEGDRTRLSLGLPQAPAGLPLRVTGSVALLAAAGRPALPRLDGHFAVAQASGDLAISLGAAGLGVRLRAPSLGLDVSLVPPGAGLAGSAAGAALHALPLVLDALAARPGGQPLKALGAALKLLNATGGFDADQLTQLGANPGPQLAARLSADVPKGLGALAALLTPALPSFLTLGVAGTPPQLVLKPTSADGLAVGLGVAPGTPPAGLTLSATLGNRAPFPGATLTGELGAGPGGLTKAKVGLQADPAGGAPNLGPLALRPRVELAAAGTRRLAVGLALDGGSVLTGVYQPGSAPTWQLQGTPSLAEAALGLLVRLAADLALAAPQVKTLLDTPVLSGPPVPIRTLLDGVLLANGKLDTGALVPADILRRLLKLAAAIAAKAPALELDPLTVRLARTTATGAPDRFGVALSLAPGQRFDLVKGDVVVRAEVDDSWITLKDGGAPGLSVNLLEMASDGVKPTIGIAIRGLGLRLSRASGPLLDAFVAVDSVGLHGLFDVGPEGLRALGGRLELGGLRVPVGGASGNDNQVASGILRDSASGAKPLAPSFSPGLSVQRKNPGAATLAVTAGSGNGPWFQPIQRGFGPVYVERVGLGVTRDTAGTTTALRVLVDGQVTLLGLTVAVDDLSLGASWAVKPLWDPTAWSVGLAGLAVSAETGGISLSGGLQRTDPLVADYIGMLSLRFGPYGLTAYGGYGVIPDGTGHFTSLFIFGALNAPIGGPPAFFVTGIGAGVGINRALRLPSSLKKLPSYPLVRALDPHSAEATQPMQAMEALKAAFPTQRGAFWFAAGVSFTSFALVDCVAVLGVAVSDGLEVSLMGLARAALPTTAAPLVQLELALLARFSTKEGVLWIQAQLTDNSWLLTRDVRLTGGFAYVSWFKGTKAGEFVITVGGYHPSFHREGYPVVPRVGFVWNVKSFLVIKGECYFALTSEAIMTGARFEASLKAGPFWAYLRLGADGIVFFDPFHYEVTAFAEIGAGITIDIDLGWFGHIRFTIGLHMHADVLVAGPDFHGRAKIDLGVTSKVIEFGSKADHGTHQLTWSEFSGKYLRPGGARVLSATAGQGQAPDSIAGTRKPPTGAPGDPFRFLPDFTVEVTSTAAATKLVLGGVGGASTTGAPLAIGPMHVALVSPELRVRIFDAGAQDVSDQLLMLPRVRRYPKGVWGAQDDSRPVPKGQTVKGMSGTRLQAASRFSPFATAIALRQVEVGPRLPLPLTAAAHVAVRANARALALDDVRAVMDEARRRLAGGALGRPLTPMAEATFDRIRTAPPQLLPLTHGLDGAPAPHVTVTTTPAAPELDMLADEDAAPPRPPVVAAVLAPAASRQAARTTVGAAGAHLPRTAAPQLDGVRQRHEDALGARLDTRAPRSPGGGVPRRPAPLELRHGRGLGMEAAARVGPADGTVRVPPGELVLLALPDAERDHGPDRAGLDVEGAGARVVAVDTAGGVTADVSDPPGTVELPARTARVAVLNGGAALDGIPGWHAGSALAQIGGRTFLAGGCALMTSRPRWAHRGGVAESTGWTTAAELLAGSAGVTTRLHPDVTAVAVMVGAEGDTALVELELDGARTVGEPIRIDRDGHVVLVYAVRRTRGAAAVTVTAGVGDGRFLCAVAGAHTSADALADGVRASGLPALVSRLMPGTRGDVGVTWRSPRIREAVEA